MQVTIQINGDKKVIARIKALGEGLYQLDDGMRQIGQYMAEYFANEGFASQGQVFGQSWPRLSQKYSIWKAKHFPGRPMEVLSGRMRQSFAYSAGSASVSIGNTDPVFHYQNNGTSRGLPARRMSGANMANKRMIADILSEEVRKKIDAAG